MDYSHPKGCEFLLGELQATGGGPVRPWMAIWHEEQGCGERNSLPACAPNTDRVTLVDVDFARSSCSVTAIGSNFASFEAGPTAGSCCYDCDGEPSDPDLPNQYHGLPLMFVRGRDQWAIRTVTSETDRATCTLGLTGVDHYFTDWTATTGGRPRAARGGTAESAPVLPIRSNGRLSARRRVRTPRSSPALHR